MKKAIRCCLCVLLFYAVHITCYGKPRTVSVPNGLLRIGNTGFVGCEDIMSISLPSSVGSIGILAFANCRHLNAIYVDGIASAVGDDALKGSSVTTYVRKTSGWVEVLGEWCGRPIKWWTTSPRGATLDFHSVASSMGEWDASEEC